MVQLDVIHANLDHVQLKINQHIGIIAYHVMNLVFIQIQYQKNVAIVNQQG
jgi:hypothetical protein